MKYSQGRFGFSVQKEIYVECGAKLDGNYPGDEVWQLFGDQTGWRVQGCWIIYSSDVIFSTSALKGHLPALLEGEYLMEGKRKLSLSFRIGTCKL